MYKFIKMYSETVIKQTERSTQMVPKEVEWGPKSKSNGPKGPKSNGTQNQMGPKEIETLNKCIVCFLEKTQMGNKQHFLFASIFL